jgi:hypothetical protein
MKSCLWLLPIIFWITACTKKECRESVFPTLKVRLVLKTVSAAKNVTEADVSFRNLKIKPLSRQPDSLFDFSGKALFPLPLNPAQSATAFEFQFRDTLNVLKAVDAVQFKYQPRTVLISEACGFTSYFDSLSVVEPKKYNFIDSVEVINRSVNKDGSITHLKIYFHQ